MEVQQVLDSRLPFEGLIESEDLYHGLVLVETEREILAILLRAYLVLLAVFGAKGQDLTFRSRLWIDKVICLGEHVIQDCAHVVNAVKLESILDGLGELDRTWNFRFPDWS